MNKRILEGRFIEGEYVKVLIDGVDIKRKVYWDGIAGDLFVWFKGSKYFLCEFDW